MSSELPDDLLFQAPPRRADKGDTASPQVVSFPTYFGEQGIRYYADYDTDELVVRIPADLLSRVPVTEWVIDRHGKVKLGHGWGYDAKEAIVAIINSIVGWHR